MTLAIYLAVLMIVFAIAGYTVGSAYGESITIAVDPEFTDPRTIPHVQLDYEGGFLLVNKIHSDSVIDLVRDGHKLKVGSTDEKFLISNNGCYTVEERTEFTWERSNKVCKNSNTIKIYEKFSYYVEKRDFSVQISDYYDGSYDYSDIQLIVLPKQTDMKFGSACPDSYNTGLQGCFRSYQNQEFIITSWETISPLVIKHELKHSELGKFHK